jgi:hypothetical protein
MIAFVNVSFFLLRNRQFNVRARNVFLQVRIFLHTKQNSYFLLWHENKILYRYIMFRRGICEKYQSRDETFPEPNGEGNLVSRLVFFANTPSKHDISVYNFMCGCLKWVGVMVKNDTFNNISSISLFEMRFD